MIVDRFVEVHKVTLLTEAGIIILIITIVVPAIFKDFYLFILNRREEREKKRKRNINVKEKH